MQDACNCLFLENIGRANKNRIFAHKIVSNLMLYKSFFSVEEESVQELSSFNVKVAIDKNHPVFAGHFPEQPVVPGVFALQMIKECLEQVLSQKLRYAIIGNCKFSNVMVPGEDKRFHIEGSYERQNKSILLKATVKTEDVTCISLKATLSVDENGAG